jgi:hypothetical protein
LLLLAAASVSLAQPPVGPPGKTLDQIQEDIWALEFLNRLDFTQEQLKQLVPAVEAFRKQREGLQTSAQATRLRAALWEVRMLLLKGEDTPAVWEKIEGLSSQMEAVEKVHEDLAQRATKQVAGMLSAKQRDVIALAETPEERLRQVVTDLQSQVAAAAEEWRDWRTDTAAELAGLAAEIVDMDEKSAEAVENRIVALLQEARAKGATYVRDSAQKILGQVLDLVVPKEHRTSQEERDERIQDWARDLLQEETVFGLLKEKLGLGGK